MEDRIVEYLCSQPITDVSGNPTDQMEYHQVDQREYDKDYCLIPSELFAFIQDTQPKEWEKLIAGKNGNVEDVKRSILDRIKSEMHAALQAANENHALNNFGTPEGTLSLIRRENPIDIGCGAKVKLAYFRPANNKTPEHEAAYRANRLAVVRQLQYSKKNTNEIDLTIFLNGLPVATLELKNALTGQTHHNAIKQYITDRNPKGEDFLTFKRCLVHFAVGTEQAYMTTRLAGSETRFFPFNMTLNNEGVESKSGYRTSYIWEDVLRRDNLLDLLQNFITVQVSAEKYYNEKKRSFDTKVQEALIFPRYHQRRAVHRLIDDIENKGAGHRYLIQHSAGSGKSNTITWLAFRLSNFYQHYNDDKALFDSVLVVTDRKVLNEQIHRNLRQFSLTEGEVAFIGDGSNAAGHDSKALKEAIEQRRRIIVTTIQKFPHISEEIALYPGRKYAVIIDEAHSSQSGSDARHMRKALSLEEAEKEDREDENKNDEEGKLNAAIEENMRRMGNKTNVSFFAFTATPKAKTIELFCERENGQKEPFDSYTMEEAIKEGYILDVLKNYMSFARYYKLVRNEKFKDKEYDKKRTVKLLTSYVDLQDSAIEKKARIMIEHFVSQTQNELNGKARAMLVTRSRLHAVRFKLKFDSIMQEMHLPYKALVAFSGTVNDAETNQEYTEAGMNGLSGNISIPQALKMPQFRILIVANKYQTGFDEPLLHTMFVDKRLGSASAVQTLSRLNRNKHGKTTMILDFVNDPEDIRADFQEYYNRNKMMEEDETDPNSLYDVKSRLLGYNAFTQEEIDEFSKYFFRDKNDKEREKINIVLDRVCDRAIRQMDADALDEFRKTCRSFSKLYTFVSQIITFIDAELEKLSAFALALSKKLPYQKAKLPYDVLKESSLESIKIKYLGKKSLELESGDNMMKGMRPGLVTPPPEEETDLLSNIIKVLNETYGINLTEEDRVDLQRMKERITSNEDLMAFFNANNSRDDVKNKFDDEIDTELLNFINGKLELYNKLTEDHVNDTFKRVWFNDLYDARVRGLR